MLEPRSNFGIAWMPDGRFFAIGGNTGASGQTSTVEMLHCCNAQVATTTPVTDTWTYVAPLPTARQCHAVAVLEGKIIVAGGLRECGVEYFTPPPSEYVRLMLFPRMPLPITFNEKQKSPPLLSTFKRQGNHLVLIVHLKVTTGALEYTSSSR